MYEIKNVLIKCAIYSYFLLAFVWTHPLTSNPIIKRPFKCLKKWFGFHFQASSSTYESLIRAYLKVKKKSALVNDWEIDVYWEESEQSEALAKQVRFVPKTDEGLERWQWCNQKNTLQFWPLFKIGIGFPST